MKKLLLFFGLILSGNITFSQCEIDPFIEQNYTESAKILALREIQSNPQDPHYDNPIIPEARYTPYLEKLSAIYENPNNISEIDSLFNEFEIKANAYYTADDYIFTKEMSLYIDPSIAWIDDFINTGVSGIASLDNLMSNYNFTIYNHIDANFCNCKWVTIRSTEIFNTLALENNFIAISGINDAFAELFMDGLSNYTGIPYYVSNEDVSVADISVENNKFTFTLYSGDCFAGCQWDKSWTAEVDNNCNLTNFYLSNIRYSSTKFSIYPNPASENIFFESNFPVNKIEVYSVLGQKVQTLNSTNLKEINISSLPKGVYFLRVYNTNEKIIVRKFIKQ